jgi:hypothetical protein
MIFADLLEWFGNNAMYFWAIGGPIFIILIVVFFLVRKKGDE